MELKSTEESVSLVLHPLLVTVAMDVSLLMQGSTCG